MAGLRETIRTLILRAQTQGIPQAQTQIKGLQSSVSHLKDQWTSMHTAAATALATITSAGAVVTVTKIARSLTDAGRDLENYRTRLNAVMRDEERAARLFATLRAESERTPFGLQSLVEASAQLELLGINAENVIRRIEDTAAVTGKSIEEVTAALVTGMQGQTRSLAQIGVTRARLEAELGRKISDVEGFTNQKELLEAIVRIMDTQFAGGIERTRDRWTVLMSDIHTGLETIRFKLSEGGFFEVMKEQLTDIKELEDKVIGSGMVEATSIAFGNAMRTIDDAFFDPFKEKLSTLGTEDMEEFSRNVERQILNIAIAINRAFLPLRGYLAMVSHAAGSIGRIEAEMDWDKRLSMIRHLYPEMFKEAFGATKAANDELEVLTNRLNELSAPRTLATFAKFAAGMKKMKEDIVSGGAGGVGGPGGIDPNNPFGLDIPGQRDQGEGMAEQFYKDMEEKRQIALETGQDMADDFYAIQQGMYDAGIEFGNDAMELFYAQQDEQLRYAVSRAQELFARLGQYNMLFVQKGMNLGRVMNAFLIRSGAEAVKALIDIKLRQAKIEAELAVGQALIAIGSGNVAGGLKMLAGAAKMFALVGLGGLATAFIESRAATAEENILGGAADGTGRDAIGAPPRKFKGTASTVRVGPQVNNFYITSTRYISGDFVQGNKGGDWEDFQRMIDEGILQIPQ